MKDNLDCFATDLRALLKCTTETQSVVETVQKEIRLLVYGGREKPRAFTRQVAIRYIEILLPFTVFFIAGVAYKYRLLVIAAFTYMFGFMIMWALIQVIGERRASRRQLEFYDVRRAAQIDKELGAIVGECEQARTWAAESAVDVLVSGEVTSELLQEVSTLREKLEPLAVRAYRLGCERQMIFAKASIARSRRQLVPMKSTAIMWKTIDAQIRAIPPSNDMDSARQLWVDSCQMTNDLIENRLDYRYAIWWAVGTVIITVVTSLGVWLATRHS